MPQERCRSFLSSRSSSLTGQLRGRLLHEIAERTRIDRRIPIELGLDRGEQVEQACWIDQPARIHLHHVIDIAHVAPLEFRECLTIEIVMMKKKVALARDERAAIAPSR